jgi:hypothetical protein
MVETYIIMKLLFEDMFNLYHVGFGAGCATGKEVRGFPD